MNKIRCIKWIDRKLNKEGYCAVIDARNVDCVKTLCGHFVMFSSGVVTADPTCEECKLILDLPVT
jgi:hypothetical protein